MSGDRALADFALHESVCINVGPFPHVAHEWLDGSGVGICFPG